MEEGVEEVLKELEKEVKACRRCPLWRSRTKPVVGEGNPKAKTMLIGEAPGRMEDLSGKPFVGAAGKLLDRLLVLAGLSRDKVYITNVLKCRPPGNRDPKPEEIRACSVFLEKQLETIKPRLILTLGRFSTFFILEKYRLLPRKSFSMLTLHGKAFTVQTLWGCITIVPLYHPASALYNPKLKSVLEGDFARIKGLLQDIGIP